MQFKLDIVAPPAEVAALVNTFYVIETQDARIEEVVPAYSAQLVVMIRGRLIVDRPDDAPVEAGCVAINAPQLGAAHCVLEGPALLIGASLTQIGWQALANLPADTVHDRLLPAETIFSAKQIAATLGISPRTVEFHKYQTMETLGLHTNAELIHFAIRHGARRALTLRPVTR